MEEDFDTVCRQGIKLSIIVLFANYYFLRIILGNLVPYLTIICYAIMIVCFFLDNGKRLSLCKEIIIWLLYMSICVLFCPLQDNRSWILGSLFDYAQRIVLCFMVIYVCIKDKSIVFVLKLVSVLAIIVAITLLIKTDNYAVRIGFEGSAIASISTNDIGSLFAFSCATIVLYFSAQANKRRSISFLILGATVMLSIVGIMLTGSRKSITSVLLFFFLVFLFCGRRIWKSLTITEFLVLIITFAMVGITIIDFLLPFFEQTSLYLRLFGYKANNASLSDQGRIDLIIQGLKDFIKHPIIGVGFNNYIIKHGAYTHCTYVEPLASSGLFGILYLFPYCLVFKKQFYLCKIESRREYRQHVIMCFFIMFLFVGVGIPYIYKDIPQLLLGMFIANQYIEFSRLREFQDE